MGWTSDWAELFLEWHEEDGTQRAADDWADWLMAAVAERDALRARNAALVGLVGALHDVLVECGDVGHVPGCGYDSEGNCNVELCGLEALIGKARDAVKGAGA
jgi:hypothetical protein